MIYFKSVYKSYLPNIDKARRRALREIFLSPPSLQNLENEKNLAVKNISFEIEKGQLIWIIGPQKSGKTTIAKLICGLIYPNHGTVEVKGTARLVSVRGISATPFTNFKNYYYLLGMSYGADSDELKWLYRNVILQETIFKGLDNENINQIPKQIMQRLNYHISLFVDADIYVFDENYYYDNPKHCGEACRGRIDEILKTKTVVVLSANKNKYALVPDKVVVLGQGKVEFFGEYKDAEDKLLSDSQQAHPQLDAYGSGKTSGGQTHNNGSTEAAAEIIEVTLTDMGGGGVESGTDQKGRIRIFSNKDININIVFNTFVEDIDISAGIDIYSGGVLAFGSRQPISRLSSANRYKAAINIPSNLLADRIYSVNVSISVYRDSQRSVVKMHNALKFFAMSPVVENDLPYSIPIMNPGIINPLLTWSLSTEQRNKTIEPIQNRDEIK